MKKIKNIEKILLGTTVGGFGIWIAVLSFKFTNYFRLLNNGNSLNSSINIFDIMGFFGLFVGVISFIILGFKKQN
jgi:hypothetical protein